MAFINKQDTNGTKGTLLKGELGYDDYTAGGDTGRVYVGNGSINIPLAKKNDIFGLKNYIINGNFDIWQRGTSQTSAGYGSDDRWSNSNNGSTKTHSQIACTDTERALFNASKFSRTVVSSVAGVANYVNKIQRIEDITKLAGKTVTLSFWAKADASKNIAINLYQDFGTGGSPSSAVGNIGKQLIAITTTWQKKTITFSIPSIVGKTLGTDGVQTSSLTLEFWFDAGSNYSQASSLGQQSGTFDIAQVQLEEGSVATPFEQRPYGLELSLCQRYYEIIQLNIAAYCLANSQLITSVPFNAVKRVFPTMAQLAGSSTNIISMDYTQSNTRSAVAVAFVSGTSATSSFAYVLSASAEL